MLKKERKCLFLKIIVSIILAIFIMMTPNYKQAEGNKMQIGDINGDGNINLTDLVLMLRHIAAKKTNKNEEWILTEEQMKLGDIVKNNEIDSSDVLALLRYMAANKSASVAEKHKHWLELEKTGNNTEEKEEPTKETEIDNIGPKIEKIEAISKAGDYKTGSEIQIKVTFDEKIYANKNKEALSNSTMPILNISFGEGKIKHPYVEENSKIENYIIYRYQITSEDKGTLKVDGAKAFDGTKTICDEAGNEVKLIAARDLTGNIITANEISINNNKTKIVLDKKVITLDLSGTKTEKIIATVTPSGRDLTWTSSNNSVATIDGKTGKVTAVAVGEADIMVKAEDGVTATCKVTVKNSVIEATGINLNKTSLTLEENNGERLTATIQPTSATNQTIKWSSSNSSIVSVSESGFVTAKKEGTVTITAKTANGKTATCQVTVKKLVIEATGISLNKTSLTLEENNGERLLATIQPTSATNQTIKWSSSNSSIVMVNESGFVTAKKAGTATITAKTANGKTATCKVTVKNSVIEVTSINLDREVLMLDKDHYNTANLSITISPTNATNKTVTWTSSNKSVATVSSNGKIKALKAGTTTITAKTSNGKETICRVTVIGQMKKTTAGNGVQGKINTSGWWIVKKVKWSEEQLESYINNAAMLCETGDYTKYPEAKAATLPYYTGAPGNNLKRKLLSKKEGISATDYLILVTTTNQQINVFHKDSKGKWNLVNTCETSTGSASNPSKYSHNRFEFYLGAIYPVPSNDGGKGNSFIEFSQSGRGWHGRMYNIEKDGQEPYCAHRAIHYGAVYSNGAPSSAGCIHLPYNGKFYAWLNKTMKGQYGTRIIVY